MVTGNHIYIPTLSRSPQTQKVRQYETTKKYVSEKGQDKNKQKKVNEKEIGNAPEKEFRVVIGKMIQDLGKRMEAQIKELKDLKSNKLGGIAQYLK